MTAITLNQDQRLFMLDSGDGFSCLGFDVVFKRLRQYAEMLGLAEPKYAEIGTKNQLEQYLKAEQAYISTKPTETLFDPGTPVAVRAYLEAYRRAGGSVRLFLGDPATGRDWLEENDVYGTIGRSMGPIKVPLLIEKGECGGGAILTANILRIVDGRSRKEVYRHASYQEPRFKLVATNIRTHPIGVQVDGKPHARFKTSAQADNWIAFMRGERMKP